MRPASDAPRASRRPIGKSRGTLILGWIGAAMLVALSKFTPARRQEPLGPPSGRLADGLPPLSDSAPIASPVPPSPPAPPPSAPRPRALARPIRLLAEAESTLVGDRAPGRPGPRDWQRHLPRPFAELRRAATPLIMPRLALPRVLGSDFVALRGLTARARPGEAVQVRLTAYCLTGLTRRGTPTRAGIVAADTRLFPLARHVHLFAAGRYLGRFRVDDTGSAVRGAHIDIWTPDCADARRFGSRSGVASLVAFGEE